MAKNEIRLTEDRFASPSGASIFYRDFVPLTCALAVPLLCLHGFMRNSRDFEELGPALAESGVRVIAPDLRGRGFSTRYADVKEYHFDLLVQDVWSLLDHLGVHRVAVLGTALGGLIGLNMAGEAPARVRGLVLNDIGAEIGSASVKRSAGHAEDADYSFDVALARVKDHFSAQYPDLEGEQWVKLMLRAYREMTPGRYARDFDLLVLADAARMGRESPDAWDAYLATRGVPIALLRGEHSDFLTADTVERMLKSHPDTVLTTVKGRGHPPLLDEPESLEAIRALLRKASTDV
ncbi:alpha/beta fold hydrolase [Variovorax sp. 22077]|uniref:alpha/beta fold hydrolase n=1 Tax=Variovorax sp. 22077 TaxID=3453867 RepID=UPI003F842104